MSHQAVEWVLTYSAARNTEWAVAVVLASHADANGRDSFPSVPTIAREARAGESTVRASLESLKARGELVEDGRGPNGTRRFHLPMETGEPAERVVRSRPKQKGRNPADPAAPRRSCGPADPAPDPPQILRSPPADPAGEPPFNRRMNRNSPRAARAREGADAARANSPDRELEELADSVCGVLQRGIDGLTTEAPAKPPRRGPILAALREHQPTPFDAKAVAIEARSIAQAQNRAPNIAALFAQKLREQARNSVRERVAA